MNNGSPDNIFEAVHNSLIAFRDELEGEAGKQVAAIGSTEGVLPDTIRSVLGSITAVLEWLYTTTLSLDKFAKSADAAVALVELVSDTLDTLSEISFVAIAEGLKLPEKPFEGIEQAVSLSNGGLDNILEAASVLPRPEDISGIKNELELLLEKTEIAEPDSMTLVKLISEVNNS